MSRYMLQVMSKTDQESNQSAHWNDLLQTVARDRNRSAFQALFTHFAPLVKAYAYKVSDLAQAEALAEELVQETMVKVWLKAATFNAEKSAAGTWIFTIARNTRIDLLRKYARQWENNNEEFDESKLSADDIWMHQQNDVLENVSMQLEQDKLLASFDVLSEEQASIMRAIFLEGKSHTESAATFGLPLGTVKSRVRLALQKLKLTIDV
jgi:RNA polymerase sigma factor (sigma-70 family)